MPGGSGPISLEALAYIVGVLLTVIGSSGTAAAWAVWKINELQRQTRLDYKEYIKSLIDPLRETVQENSNRIQGLESFNSGVIVTMRELNSFRREIKEDFRDLREERQSHMKNLNDKLDRLQGDKTDGRN